jgi:hypothetical protein
MSEEVTVLFGGDCHFGNKPLRLERRLRERISQADLVVVNQESPITAIEIPVAQKPVNLRSSTDAATWLQDLGVKVASLANNHIADYGQNGLEETISRLQSTGITTVGAGAHRSAASSPACINLADGRTIAFLAFTSRGIGSKIAGEADYGCAELEPPAIERAIRRVRDKASHVVLMLHYGLTNFSYPTPQERGMLRSFAGCGVDLVIGHHHHLLHGQEVVGGVPILYSLGNLIFASYRKRGQLVPLAVGNRRGALVAVAFSPRGARITDIIFTETTETEDRLVLDVAQSAAAAARSFKARSKNLERSSYAIFFQGYAIRRLLYRLLLWTSPRRWPTVSGAQLKSFWLSLSYVAGRRE